MSEREGLLISEMRKTLGSLLQHEKEINSLIDKIVETGFETFSSLEKYKSDLTNIQDAIGFIKERISDVHP